ncbi:MAG: iron complex outermembrane receptor protein, partial [Halioglobus sp.]
MPIQSTINNHGKIMTSRSSLRGKTIKTLTPRNSLSKAVSAVLMASVVSSPTLAQSLEEVIVTATKRSESVQDVALAITALSGDFVNKVNLDDVKDLVSFTPGVTGNSQ